MADRRRTRRNKLIEMSGGACVKCSSVEELNFDHKDPKERSFRLTGKALDGSWATILSEWAKCQLLCRVCHNAKTKANDEYAEPWNKGISRYSDGTEHGSESAYIRGCRCVECCRAKYEGRVRRGESKGVNGPRGPNSPQGVIKHGTRAGYEAERRLGLTPCDECRKANAEVSRMRKQNEKLLASGISGKSTPLLPETVLVRGQPCQPEEFDF